MIVVNMEFRGNQSPRPEDSCLLSRRLDLLLGEMKGSTAKGFPEKGPLFVEFASGRLGDYAYRSPWEYSTTTKAWLDPPRLLVR